MIGNVQSLATYHALDAGITRFNPWCSQLGLENTCLNPEELKSVTVSNNKLDGP